mmetsp:Transcript_40072/g.114537  ORF Transcript_40072/g.114537 Transcript_40072/m.114537 type:complete len:396 (-) Transcript_40072:96-1283(-)
MASEEEPEPQRSSRFYMSPEGEAVDQGLLRASGFSPVVDWAAAAGSPSFARAEAGGLGPPSPNESPPGALGPAEVLPPWVDWPRFRMEYAVPQQLPKASSDVPVGVRSVPVGGGCEATGRRRALLVGVGYFGTPAELGGSMNDVANVRALLLRLGFNSEWIICLTDDQQDPAYQPTRQNMLTAMQWLLHGAVAGDAFFFHFSGHSAQELDPGCPGALDDALCPADPGLRARITENELFALLVRPLPAGARLTVLVDCCLPSCLLDLAWACDGRGWREALEPQHAEGDCVCLSAEPLEDISPEGLQELRRRPSGLLTEAFCDGLQQLAQLRRGPVTHLELLEEVRGQLCNSGHLRRPRLSASQAFDPARTFRFSDAVPNGNAEVGLRRPKQHHWRR